jgi:hypothetical protein
MRFVIQEVAFVLLFLVCMGTPARADADTIDLENQTYTPLHYRVRPPGAEFSGWRVVLPGETSQYSSHAQMVIDVWCDEERSEKYNLRRGNRYTYYRGKPGAVPEFAACEGPGPAIPSPPGAPPANTSSGDACFAPLSRFVARCKELKQPYCLSLKSLAAECARAQKVGGGLPAELRYLHGFTWFVGYVVDDAKRDVMLLGVKDPTRPPANIDCLATAIKAAYSGSVPYCSLDADPNPALQKCVIRGVPWKSHWAEVMIRADYDMKRLAVGRWDPGITGFKSWKRHVDEIVFSEGWAGEGPATSEGSQTRFDQNRWWFNFNSAVPRAIADEAGKVVYLHGNPVRLSTEQLVKGSFGSGQTTVSATRFAEGFTEHVEVLGTHYPNIAELLAMYRLYDLVRHLREASRAMPPDMAYWVKKYEHPYEGPPATMPTLTSTRMTQVLVGARHRPWRIQTRGGVEMRLGITGQSLKRVTRPTGLSPDANLEKVSAATTTLTVD